MLGRLGTRRGFRPEFSLPAGILVALATHPSLFIRSDPYSRRVPQPVFATTPSAGAPAFSSPLLRPINACIRACMLIRGYVPWVEGLVSEASNPPPVPVSERGFG